MRLWLDDVRPMPPDYDLHVKSVEEALFYLMHWSITHISFDHDLGMCIEECEADDNSGLVRACEHPAPTGYNLAKWIEMQAHDNSFGRISWDIHSANPAGTAAIRAAMESAERAWRKE